MARWNCLGLKMPILDFVTIGWDNCFGPGEHEDESTCVEGDEFKVYKISLLDGENDSMEFGNIWGGDEVSSNVGMDIRKYKFWDVVGKEEIVEVKFEFLDMVLEWFVRGLRVWGQIGECM